ncbi:MAG: CsbD family protein [Anaerolineae bacterium]
MNDILQGNWKQLRGHVREWWGNLTDDDLTKIDGKRENLVGILQTRYGHTKERAESEVNARLAEWEKAQGISEKMALKH